MPGILSSGVVLQNRYQIVNRLGQGGMGAVYLAHDLRLGKRVALKETLDVSPQAQQQFGREARFLARLQHPRLPRVTDSFAQTGRYYLVMDYVPGQDLEAWGRQHGPASPAQALTWADQVLDALTYLHRQSPPIIHRDVKPANVKITPDGQAVLVDFGIAKELVPGQYTLTGAQALSPGYAPPEQYAAQGQTDARTDIYGLGATLYFLLTGAAPVDAMERAAGKPLPLPRQVNPRSQVPPAVERVVIKALALQKQDRWQSAAEMRRALRQAAAATGPPPTPSPRTPRPAPTQPQSGAQGTSGANPLLWILGITAAVLVVALILLTLLAVRSNDQSSRRLVATATAQMGQARLTQTALAQPQQPPTTPTALPATTAPLAPPATEPPATPLPGQPTSTLAPTPTPAPPTPKPTKKQGTSPTKPPTSSPPPTYPAPILAAPEDGAEGLNGNVRFEWRWNGPALKTNDYFDLRIWSEEDEKPGGAGRRGVIAPTKATSALVNLDGVATIQEHGEGIYYWGVVVVQKKCPGWTCEHPKIIGEWSETRSFTYTPRSEGPTPGPKPTSAPTVPRP